MRLDATSSTRWIGVTLVVLAGLAGWFSWSAHQRAADSARRLQVVERHWTALSRAEPAPTAAVAAQWAARRKALENEIHQIRHALGENRESATIDAAVPTQRAEAFFAIAQFVDHQRALARAAGVDLPAGYALGFSAYANSGPPDAELAIVHRQLRVVEALLSVLWRSGAKELTRVQRELPAGKLADATGAMRAGRGEGRPEDYLQVAPGRRLVRAGIVDTIELRIGFIGRTATLRRFLNDLAALPLPLVVRAVEVEPLGADGAARGGVRTLADLFGDDVAPDEESTAERAAVPIIAANEAEFLVTVACLNFAPLDAAADPGDGEDAP